MFFGVGEEADEKYHKDDWQHNGRSFEAPKSRRKITDVRDYHDYLTDVI